MQSIHTYSFANKKALIRVDFNVPLDKTTFEVTDSNRIKAAVPTIQKVLSAGGSVILLSHLGRPKKGPEDAFSLRHILKSIEELCQAPVLFCSDCISEEAQKMSTELKPGQILLLENVRFYAE